MIYTVIITTVNVNVDGLKLQYMNSKVTRDLILVSLTGT